MRKSLTKICIGSQKCRIFFSFFFFLLLFLFFLTTGPARTRALQRTPTRRKRRETIAWNSCSFLLSWRKFQARKWKKNVCKCRNNMFLSLCHPYVSQSRWRLVFLTPEKYSNSQISVKDWIDIRCRIEQENLLSSYRKLLRNESYVIVEDSFIHVFHLLAICSPYTCRVQINCRSDSKDSSFVKR